jgi:hypothetical protein
MILPTTTFKIKCPVVYTSAYASQWPFLSWISEPNHNNKATQLTSWNVCREIHIGFLKEQFTKLVANADKTRFALRKVYSKKEMPSKKWPGIVSYDHRSMVAAIHVLNLIEKKAGWELTTITKTKINTGKASFVRVNTYIITGPAEWMGSIPLISLYLLIIRSCWFIEFHRIKRLKDIKTACEKLIKKKVDTTRKENHIADVKRSYKYWLLLVLNTKFMFGGRNHRSLYTKNNRTMGITALVKGSTDMDNTTIERWNLLLAKGQ